MLKHSHRSAFALLLAGASTLGMSASLDAAESASSDPATNAERIKSVGIFGEQAGQHFDLSAVHRLIATPSTQSLSVTLPPDKGAEIQAPMKQGEGFTFHWEASSAVDVDMHGERPNAGEEYTTYWVQGAERSGAGLFAAPFDGNHGWYWRNRGKTPVTVTVTVTGVAGALFRPTH